MKFLIQSLLFFTSSCLILALSLLNVPIPLQQQIILIVLTFIFLLVSRLLLKKDASPTSKWLFVIIFFISSFLVQLIILSSGGLNSPFLVLLHLFTITLTLFLNLPSAIIFLTTASTAIAIYTYMKPHVWNLAGLDYPSIILYLLSFIVILTLGELLARKNRVKDEVTSVLNRQIKLEQTILSGVTELVFITDKSLKVISFNETAKRVLNISLNQAANLMEYVHLKTTDGNLVSKEMLISNNFLYNKVSVLIPDFFLKTPSKIKTGRVLIKLQPILDATGEIEHIIVVISEVSNSNNLSSHEDLQKAHLKFEKVLFDLKKMLPTPQGKFKLDLLGNILSDINLAMEINDHPFISNRSIINLSFIAHQVTAQKIAWAKYLKSSVEILVYSGSNEAKLVDDELTLSLSNTPLPKVNQISDSDHLITLLQKLLDIAIILSLDSPNPRVQLIITDNPRVSLTFNISIIPGHLPPFYEKALFEEYYGVLAAMTQLSYGSGLEGIIAKHIADQLNIKITPNIEGTNSLTLRLDWDTPVSN